MEAAQGYACVAAARKLVVSLKEYWGWSASLWEGECVLSTQVSFCESVLCIQISFFELTVENRSSELLLHIYSSIVYMLLHAYISSSNSCYTRSCCSITSWRENYIIVLLTDWQKCLYIFHVNEECWCLLRIPIKDFVAFFRSSMGEWR